jgi:murein L,D-transpeptidase YcbB/YkuD
MHDTPLKNLSARTCASTRPAAVRVQNVRELVNWL